MVTDGCDISFEIVLLWMSLYLTDDKSTSVQVMAWCHQSTSHYLSQCWPKAMPPFGVTGPHRVNTDQPAHSSSIAFLQASIAQTDHLWPLWLLSQTWMNNYFHNKVWDEITNPSFKFNCATAEVWELIIHFIPHTQGHVITYSCWY